MEGVVEATLEATNHLVDRHFDSGWDRLRAYRNGTKVRDEYTSYQTSRSRNGNSNDDANANANANATANAKTSRSAWSDDRAGQRTPTGTAVKSAAGGGAAQTTVTAAGAARAAASTRSSPLPGSRRRQRDLLPPVDCDTEFDRRDSARTLRQESEASDRVLREYELETDDPKRKPESVLPSRDIRSITRRSRKDSAMASGYNDDYTQSRYEGETSRPRSQPPRSRYYDDDESDYDDRSGRRYAKSSGRGYDDRDYDRVVEETERYRGPPVNRPWDPARQDSYRSGYDGPYGSGTVTQYGRRSDGALDRQETSYSSRRSKSRGRYRDDDRSYSRSVSRSRSRSREQKDGWREKLDETFDTSARGLGVGVAGAVIGGLAGREFGGSKHRQRDIIIGAVVGGLGANLAENKWREWKDGRDRDVERDEDRYEQKWDSRDYGRSRSEGR